jgi:hypothetical protein
MRHRFPHPAAERGAITAPGASPLRELRAGSTEWIRPVALVVVVPYLYIAAI